MKLFVVFATHRSGHHGILNWICTQHGSITHYNNAHTRTIDGRLFRFVKPHAITVYGEDPQDVALNLEGFRFQRWADERWDRLPTICDAAVLQPVLIIRRFRNWLASCASKDYNRIKGKPTRELMDKWHTLLGNYRNHLKAAIGWPTPFYNLVTIRFDDWFVDEGYRRIIAEQLDIEFTDAGLHRVPKFGGGSTFDKQAFDGNAQHMGVLDRWKQAAGNETYEWIMQHNEDLDQESEAFFATSVHPPASGTLPQSHGTS
jgi:hypothetical protein